MRKRLCLILFTVCAMLVPTYGMDAVDESLLGRVENSISPEDLENIEVNESGWVDPDKEFNSGGIFADVDNASGVLLGTAGSVYDSVDMDTVNSINNFMQKPAKKMASFFFGGFAGYHALTIAIELTLLTVTLFRSLLGENGNGSNNGYTGMGNPNNPYNSTSQQQNTGRIRVEFLSDEYKLAVQSLENLQSGVGAAAGAGTANASDVNGNATRPSIFWVYGKAKVKTIIICLIVAIFLLTPVGWDIIVFVVTTIIKLGLILFYKAKEVILPWLGSISGGL